MAYGTVNADVIGTSVAGSNLGAGNATQFKNRIINGAMVIDQRNAGASGTASAYTVDRWQFNASLTTKGTWQQNAGSLTGTNLPVGFTNYLGFTSNSAYSVGTSELFTFQQKIEGTNISDLAWGTANAKTITLSFWVRSSLTGTFGGSLRNSAADRSYPYTYTISSANTWEQKSVTIAGDTTGTWLTTNGIGVSVIFGLGVGSTFSGTAGAWAGANYISATGATSVVGTNGATFYITGVQLEVGESATGFDRRPYGTELALCQRYYFKVEGSGTGSTTFASGYNQSTTTAVGFTPFKVSMRDRPTALEQSGTAANYTVAHGASSTACSSVPTFASRTSLNGGSTVFTVASGLTTGQGCELTTANAATSYLAWSAEL